MLRSCYETDVRICPNSLNTVRGSYYFLEGQGDWLSTWHSLGSMNYFPRDFPPSPIGEVVGGLRQWRNGSVPAGPLLPIAEVDIQSLREGCCGPGEHPTTPPCRIASAAISLHVTSGPITLVTPLYRSNTAFMGTLQDFVVGGEWNVILSWPDPATSPMQLSLQLSKGAVIESHGPDVVACEDLPLAVINFDNYDDFPEYPVPSDPVFAHVFVTLAED